MFASGSVIVGSMTAGFATTAVAGGPTFAAGVMIWQNAADGNDGSDSGSDCADQIANGHAYNDHIGDFPGVRSRSDFAQVARDVMKNGISRVFEMVGLPSSTRVGS